MLAFAFGFKLLGYNDNVSYAAGKRKDASFDLLAVNRDGLNTGTTVFVFYAVSGSAEGLGDFGIFPRGRKAGIDFETFDLGLESENVVDKRL